jgi:hypothetical protein
MRLMSLHELSHHAAVAAGRGRLAVEGDDEWLRRHAAFDRRQLVVLGGFEPFRKQRRIDERLLRVGCRCQ